MLVLLLLLLRFPSSSFSERGRGGEVRDIAIEMIARGVVCDSWENPRLRLVFLSMTPAKDAGAGSLGVIRTPGLEAGGS
jgi:hypothetical protein